MNPHQVEALRLRYLEQLPVIVALIWSSHDAPTTMEGAVEQALELIETMCEMLEDEDE